MKTELLGATARFFSPVGELVLRSGPAGLTEVAWGCRKVDVRAENPGPGMVKCPTLARAVAALDRYFAGNPLLPHELGEVPVDLSPLTRFRQTVMGTLTRSVPWGEVISYAELAALAGYPGAARAVGSVMARNPLPLFIPCHRVVGSSGPGGFGPGLSVKRQLLLHEGFELAI